MISWECDSIEELKYDNFSIFKLSNLKSQNNNQSDTIFISGKSSIIAYDNFFWHFLQEGVGQYELINDCIKDVNLVFIDILSVNKLSKKDNCIDTLSTYIPKSEKFFIDFFNMYSKTKYVYDIYQSNVVFEELYIILDFRNIFKEDLFKKHGNFPYWFIGDGFYNRHNVPSGEWQFKGLSLLRNKFLNILEKDFSFPKKIYISREDANARYKNGGFTERDVETRLFEEDKLLKDYFVNLGYTPVCFEGMPNIEQAKFIFNAKQIIGPIGSGFLNTIFCDKDSTVFELHVKPKFSFTYKYVSHHVVQNQFYSIDLKKYDKHGNPVGTMSIAEINKYLENYKALF